MEGSAAARRTYLPKSTTRALMRCHSTFSRRRGVERMEGLLAPVGMMNVSATVDCQYLPMTEGAGLALTGEQAEVGG